MKRMKRILSLLMAILLVVGLTPVAFAATDPTFEYDLLLTDAAGAEIQGLSRLTDGDTVHVKIVLRRTDIEGDYNAYAVEFKLTTAGLDYQNDGQSFRGPGAVTHNVFGDTDVVGITYYDMSEVGETVSNPLEVCSWSYQVRDTAAMSLNVTTAIIFAAEGSGMPSGKAVLELDPNGGSIVGADVGGEYDRGAVVTLPDAEREGQTFLGWSDGEHVYPAGSEYKVQETRVTLVAQWAVEQAAVTLDSSGGTIPAGEDPSGTYDVGTVIVLPTPTREGYDFQGWSDGVDTYGTGNYTVNGPVTLTAKWRQQETPGPGPIPGPGPVEPTPPDEPDRPVYEEPDWVGAKLNTAEHFNYVIGYPDGTVHPTANITRAEVATIFYRLLTEESRAAYGAETNEYSDVKTGDWFNTAVSTLSSVGVLKGYPDGSFRPNRNITRAELTAVITRFAQQVGGTAPFSDVDGHWAYGSIAMAAAKGWINGYEDGTFRPDREITRAETFAMVNRMLGRLPETKADLHSGMITFPDNMDESAWYYLDVQDAANNHEFSRKADGLHETWTAKLEDIRW